MAASAPSFFARLGLSFKVLFDESLAQRLVALSSEPRALEPAPAPVARYEAAPAAEGSPKTMRSAKMSAPLPADEPVAGALSLLSILQREGRFIDFLQQNIDAFPDAEVGAAARVVHEGCRRSLAKHAKVSSIRAESEGSRVTLDVVSPEVKLVGNVAGSAPYRGVLRHRGWRIEELKLPTRVGDHDPSVVAPAEVEL
jgi:hypothetical protein